MLPHGSNASNPTPHSHPKRLLPSKDSSDQTDGDCEFQKRSTSGGDTPTSATSRASRPQSAPLNLLSFIFPNGRPNPAFHCIQHPNPPVMMTMTRSRLALLLVQLLLLCWIDLARASIVRGFSAKEFPELKDIPNIADQVRKRSSKIRITPNKASSQPLRLLQAGKSSKSEGPKEVIDTTNQNDPGRAARHPVGKQDEASSIPEAAPEFNAAGELSFVIVSDSSTLP
jgi:hypothetical protein